MEYKSFYWGDLRVAAIKFLSLMKDTSESVEAEWKHNFMTRQCVTIWTKCLSFYRLKPIINFLQHLRCKGIPLKYLKNDWDDAFYCTKNFEIYKFSIDVEKNIKEIHKFVVECKTLFIDHSVPVP